MKSQHTGRGLEHLLDAEDGGDKGIYLLAGVVEGEGGAAGALDAEAAHEGFGTMVAGTDGDAETVEQGAHVEVVDVADLETDDGIVVAHIGLTVLPYLELRAEDFHAGDFHEALHGVGGEVALMSLDGIEAYETRRRSVGHRGSDGGDVVERTGEACGGDVVGRAGFELIGEVVEGGVLEGYGLYHLAAAHVGGQAVEPLLLAIKDADAGGTVYLVTAEGEEVAVEVLHVDAEVGRALGSVDEDGDAVGMGYADDFLDGVDGAKDIADVGEGDDFSSFVEEGLDTVEAYGTVVGDGEDAEADALPLLEQLPRDDVGVVLHLGEDDFVALTHEGLAEAGGYEVDALGGATGEDDFAGGTGVEEAADGLARLFVEVGGLLGKEVHAAMDVGIDVVVFVGHGLDDAARLLCRGGVVEVDEGVLVVDAAPEDGEVGANLVYGGHGVMGGMGGMGRMGENKEKRII